MSTATPDDQPSGNGGGRTLASVEPEPGVRFRLSAVTPSETEAGTVDTRRVEGDPLTEDEIQALLARVEPLEADTGDRVESALVAGPRPPEITGAAVMEPFPPAEEANLERPAVDPGPLEVTRFQPEGDVDVGSHVALSFSRPMVPIASRAELSRLDVPLVLEPEPAGQWRWIGTRTLLFEPDGRLPMATEYTARVEPGTTSVDGASLDSGHEWTFRTPPVSMRSSAPYGDSVGTQPVIFLGFDQAVDPDDALRLIEVSAEGERVEIRAATVAEIEASDVATLVSNTVEGRWIAIRPESPIAKGAHVQVTVPRGFPSAEGPRVTESDQSFEFSIYGPLTVTEVSCGGSRVEQIADLYRLRKCDPFEGWQIFFSNPLETSSVAPGDISIEPAAPGLDMRVDSGGIQFNGLAAGRTSYVIRLPDYIRDVYGQNLGTDVEIQIETKDGKPILWGPGEGIAVLDPTTEPIFSVQSMNNRALDVRIYAAPIDIWPVWERPAYLLEEESIESSLLVETRIEPQGPPNTLVDVPIDLSEALDDGLGQVIVVVVPDGWDPDRDGQWNNQPVVTWVQSTRLGLDTVVHRSDVTVWVTDLASGEPLEGVNVRVAHSSAATNNDGLVRLPSLGDAVVATRGRDIALARQWSLGGASSSTPRTLLFNDKGIYLPGERVHVKGWIRMLGAGPQGDLEPSPVEPDAQLEYRFIEPRTEATTAEGQFLVTEAGGFGFSFDVPLSAELGTGRVEIYRGEGRIGVVAVEVAEFRRPEFEVKTSLVEADHFIGDTVEATALAEYYAGGRLAGSDVTWHVTGRSTHYAPPGHEGFHFGRPVLWWMRPVNFDDYGYRDSFAMADGPLLGDGVMGWPMGEGTVETLSTRTDAEGTSGLAVAVDGVHPLSPASLAISASVTDVNRQTWASEVTALVHPASLYVGLRPREWFTEPGDDYELEMIVADLEGNLVPDTAVSVRAELRESTFRNGDYVESFRPVSECDAESSLEPVSCALALEEPGSYRILARVHDSAGRPNETELTAWVSGPISRKSRTVEAASVQIVPDRTTYAPGDVARFMAIAPVNGTALVTFQRSGLLDRRVIAFEDGSAQFELEIEDYMLPNLFVEVDVAGKAIGVDEDDGDGTPAFASGKIDVPISTADRRLGVAVNVEETELVPGASTDISVRVTDVDGNPIPAAEVAMLVVDESVLALKRHAVPDPVTHFYSEREALVAVSRSRDWLLRAVSPSEQTEAMPPGAFASIAEERVAYGMADSVNAMAMSAEMGVAAESPAPSEATIAERVDMTAAALFEPNLVADGNGVVTARVTLPDSVTRYRVTAVAADSTQRFGKAETSLVARLPLTVRPSAPRFANYGDTFELPVVVQNGTDDSIETSLAVRTTNLSPETGQGKRVTVPARDRVEVLFPLQTAEAGTARIQVVVSGDGHADAQRLTLPVWTPVTTEAFATYGEIDAGAIRQPVRRPTNVVEAFGGLELTTTSTALGNLSDAYLYLQDYPFECAEQIASRLLANAALMDVVDAFAGPTTSTTAEARAQIEADLNRLISQQRHDGGFGWWRDSLESAPFVTVHAAHALVRAEAKGFELPETARVGVRQYLTDIRNRLPSTWSLEAQRSVRAYAAYVLDLAGESVDDKAVELYREDDEPPVDRLAWLISILADSSSHTDVRTEMLRQLGNRASEEAATAQFAVQYVEGEHLILASNRRADALALEALIRAEPTNDLVVKVARGLLAHRTKGRWASTQENVWVLIALDLYFRTYESVEPDFEARAWLGDAFAGSTRFEGRSADRHETVVPMQALSATDTDLTLSKEGDGRLYYRIGLRYAPQDLELEPLESGFAVSREYEAVDDPLDVTRDADGRWTVKAGARVRVRVRMAAPERRYHVALTDPMPAGFEPLNPELAVTEALPPDTAAEPNGWWSWWRWYEHQALRDERAEAFQSLLYPGEYSLTYIARATTPGEFVAPPAKAEEMYHPETFGRSGTDFVSVR